MSDKNFIPLNFTETSEEAMIKQAQALFQKVKTRRSVREFSSKKFDISILTKCIEIASSAPSGANMQPWFFHVVSSTSLKKQIREAAEAEERKNYEQRMNQEWLDDLHPLGTDANKPFLENAPYLVILCKIPYGIEENSRKQHYYVKESVGIAAGFFIMALHQVGLCTLTHTPTPMGFLSDILELPKNHIPFLLLPVGYPTVDLQVPNISKKKLKAVFKHHA